MVTSAGSPKRVSVDDRNPMVSLPTRHGPWRRALSAEPLLAPARGAGSFATVARRSRRRRAVLRTPSGSGSESSGSPSASTLAQLHRLVAGLTHRMDGVEERLHTVFDDIVVLVSSTLDIAATMMDGASGPPSVRCAVRAPPGLQPAFPTLPAFPFSGDAQGVAEAAASAAPKPGSVDPLIFSLFENDDEEVAENTADGRRRCQEAGDPHPGEVRGQPVTARATESCLTQIEAYVQAIRVQLAGHPRRDAVNMDSENVQPPKQVEPFFFGAITWCC